MSTQPDVTKTPKPNRNWFTFSLRTLLVVTLILGVALGYLGRQLFPPPEEPTVVEKLYALGADIGYDYEAIKLKGIQPAKRGGDGRWALFHDFPETEISSVAWQA